MSDPLTPTIRLATTTDAAQIASLVGRVWVKNFGWSVTPEDITHLQTETLSLSKISNEIEDHNITYIVSTLPSRPPPQPESNQAKSTDQADQPPSETIIGIIQLVSGTSEPCLTLPSPIELRRLYVEDGFHGMGIAQRLFKYATDWSRGRKRESMWLGVWEQNPRGQAFYRKMGFEVVGEHSFVVGASVRRDWVMEVRI